MRPLLLAVALLVPTAAVAQAGKVLAELPCPAAEPMGMAPDGEHLWISDLASRELLKVRTADGGVVARVPATGHVPTGVALHAGVLFSADRELDSIARQRLGDTDGLSPLPYYERWPAGMVHDGQSLWVVNNRDNKIHRIDPADGTTIETFDAPGSAPTGIAFDGRYLWVADHKCDELFMVDRRNGDVIQSVAAPGPYPSALAVSQGSLWVADYQTQRLYRVALPGAPTYVEDQERRVHASYEISYRAKGAGKVLGLTAYVAMPAEPAGQHKLSELTFSPAPDRVVTDKWGQKIAVFELGDLPAGETRRVRWDGDFAVYRTRFQLVPEQITDPARSPELAPYLADDAKYDLHSPGIAELVEKLTQGKQGTYERARAIYDHLTRTIKYDRTGGWNNAAAVLERGTGSCSEYTFALVALLRKAGIPARYVGAISERGDEASFDDVFHRWAEAWLPGYGWVPIDANAGAGASPGERGNFFGGRSNRHVITTVGGGASEYLGWNYNHDETYRVSPGASLEVQPLARYRPMDAKAAAPAIAAHTPASQPVQPVLSGMTGHSWGLAGSLALVGLVLGIALGRAMQRD